MYIPTKLGSNGPSDFRRLKTDDAFLVTFWPLVFLVYKKHQVSRGPSNKHSYQVWFQY